MLIKTFSKSRTRRLCIIVNLAIVCEVALATITFAAAGDPELLKRRQQAVAPLQADYDRIVAKAGSDPELGQFQTRLGHVNEIGDQLFRRFRSTKAASLDALLDGAPKAKTSRASQDKDDIAPSAAELYSEYQDEFAQALPKPANASPEDLNVLVKYYDTVIATTEQLIAERGKMMASIDKKAGTEVPRLCVVLSFLHRADDQWGPADIAVLAPWLRQPGTFAVLEDFALAVRRPLTAYQFAQMRLMTSTKPTMRPTTQAYLNDASLRLRKANDYSGAISCLNKALEIAGPMSPDNDVALLHISLADVYAEVGHPDTAANEVKKVLDAPEQKKERGKAAMLRMKYLYETQRFDEVLREAESYRVDDRCAEYLPQILYLTWVTQRRSDQMTPAQTTQDLFFQKFPDHPLGADMHFAAAMAALAENNDAEATRQLEIIQYKYPKSKLLPKVEELRDRLQQAVRNERH